MYVCVYFVRISVSFGNGNPVYAEMCVRIYVSERVYVCVCVCVYVYEYVCVCVNVCFYVPVCVCVHACFSSKCGVAAAIMAFNWCTF